MLFVKIWIVVLVVNIIFTRCLRNYFLNNPSKAFSYNFDRVFGIKKRKTPWFTWVSALFNIFLTFGALWIVIWFLFFRG